MSSRVEQPHDPTIYSTYSSSYPSSTAESYSTSASSAPSTRPVSCRSEDETSSEGVEPLTPTSDSHSHPFHHRDSMGDHAMAAKFPDLEPGIGPLGAIGPLEASKLASFPKPPQNLPTQPNTHHTAVEPRTVVPSQPGATNDSSKMPQQPVVPQPLEPLETHTRWASDSDGTPTAVTPERSNSHSKIAPLIPPVPQREPPKPPYKDPSHLPPMCPPLAPENERQGRRPERIITRTVSSNGRKASPPKDKPLPSLPPTSPTTAQKPGLVKRLTHRLGRANSTNKTPTLAAESPIESRSGNETESTNTSTKSKKLGDKFSFSARTSPNTSQSNTPPTPGSPSGSPPPTIEELPTETSSDPEMKVPFGHNHSNSATGLHNFSRPRQGITWAGSNVTADGQLRAMSPRRRSASTEQVPKLQDKDVPVIPELRPTFSTRATEGTGLKARRLSTSLPDEFQVDFCELNKEYKSSSFLPGRRGHLVGKGATATVRLMCQKDGPKEKLFAVKEFRGKNKDEDEHEYVMKVKSEYSIAKSLVHPNIVQTIRLCTHSGRWNHVMEYCELGEIYPLVERGLFRTHYKLEDRLCFFKQMIRGVDYLHSHGIAHRDIKLENLLMNAEGHIKISDFGVSEVFSGEHPGVRSAGGQCGKNMGEVRRCAPGICGSLPYIAPEVLDKKGDYDPRPLDVWSCAIVFLTMTYGGSPWQAAKPEYEHYAKFKKGWEDWLPNHPDGEVKDAPDGVPKCGLIFSKLEHGPLKRLLLKMLHPIPKMRISIRDVLNTGVIRGAECCSPESMEDDACCIDACKGGRQQQKPRVVRKHNHLPPKVHKTPEVFRHRFDMGDGWN